ncbi:MAG TPA: hypothetical protein VNA44_09160 [Burkholderiaceae bacterium]|nr:hypothetical protein [Burkholderiaceae bacterium]
MNDLLIIVGVGLVVLTPVMLAIRLRPKSRKKEQEYFAAARKRAISFRPAGSTSARKPEAAGE